MDKSAGKYGGYHSRSQYSDYDVSAKCWIYRTGKFGGFLCCLAGRHKAYVKSKRYDVAISYGDFIWHNGAIYGVLRVAG